MNMTVILMSKRSIELLVVCIYLLCVTSKLALVAGDNVVGNEVPADIGELPASARVVVDENHILDDAQLGSVVDDFGKHIKSELDVELEKLIQEIESSKELRQQRYNQFDHSKNSPADKTSITSNRVDSAIVAEGRRQKSEEAAVEQESIKRLQDAKKYAPEDIEKRIKLAGTTEGHLPQWSLMSETAKNFLATTSDRLQTAGLFVTDRMRAIGGQVVDIPLKLRKFFRWPTFLSFKSKFNKQYKSLREELYRQMIYLQSSVRAGIQWVRYLLRLDRHLLGATQFADKTEDEYKNTFGNKMAASETQTSDPSQTVGFSPETMAKLKTLSKSGKNIFGHQVNSKEEHESSDQAGSQQHQRSKRDANLAFTRLGLSQEELDELSEQEHGSIGNDLFNNGAEDQQPEEIFIDDSDIKMLEEYSNANLDQLDAGLEAADVALAENDEDKPIDLRETGCILKPDNQADCGVCYAHVLAAVARYYNCMDKSIPSTQKYHPMFIGSCGNYYSPLINGCQGAYISVAFGFIKDSGVKTFTGYISDVFNLPNEDSGLTVCPYPAPAQPFDGTQVLKDWRLDQVDVFKKTRFWRIAFDQIKRHLTSIGPVFINFECFKFFRLYDAGIYDEPEEEHEIIRKNPGVFRSAVDPMTQLYRLSGLQVQTTTTTQPMPEGVDGGAKTNTDDDGSMRDPSQVPVKPRVDIHSMFILGYDYDSKGREYYIIWNSHGPVWGNGGFLHIYADALKKRARLIAGLQPLEDIQIG